MEAQKNICFILTGPGLEFTAYPYILVVCDIHVILQSLLLISLYKISKLMRGPQPNKFLRLDPEILATSLIIKFPIQSKSKGFVKSL